MHVAHKNIKQKIVIQAEIYLSGIAEMIQWMYKNCRI